ncbi:T-complex protein 11-like protein 1 isoform X2 [Corticium candelabrum]|uniref:T-complex protein 11-like protein 1 isoform X2 n=1 Tax=Corticium candelabrum TaxID=121492 RepID=UPI002E363B0D|nr:T-complex protein 11-like protein 1 isoform X2 [Corticium candelabrum]
MSDNRFWWIDCREKSTIAGSPHHLAQRLANRVNNQTVGTEDKAADKRRALLDERRRRLTENLERVYEVRRSHEERLQREKKSFRTNLEYRMQTAVAYREKRLRRLVLSCGKEVKRAKYVANERKRRLQFMNADACCFLDQAVRKIQRWWRQVWVRIALRTCSETLPSQLLRTKPPLQFATIQRLITSKAALKPTRSLFATLNKMNVAFASPASARIFLSAFAICNFPSIALGQNGGLKETNLEALAAAIVHCFRLLLKGFHQNIESFVFLWQQYIAAFDEWKKADKQRLILELCAFWKQAEQLKRSILGNNSLQTDAQVTVVQDIDHRMQQLEQDLRRLGGWDTMRAVQMESGASSQEIDKPELPQILKGAIEKMMLTHELNVNASFKLEPHKPPGGSLEELVTGAVHKAFWESLQGQLDKNPPEYHQALGLLAEVKQGLLELIPPHHSTMKDEVNQVLDYELVSQQAQHGILNIGSYADFIVSVLLCLCSPERDETVKSLLLYKGNVVELFKNVFKVLEQLKLDLANFQLQMIKPHLRLRAAEHEREKFQEFLEISQGDLRATKKWLKIAKRERNASKMINHENIIAAAMANLLFWPDQEDYPETWQFDVIRLKTMQSEFYSLVSLCACMTVAASSPLGQPLQRDKDLLDHLKRDLLCVLRGRKEINLKEVSSNVAEQVKAVLLQWRNNHQLPPPSPTAGSNLYQLVKATFCPQHPVFQLLLSRLKPLVEDIVYMNPRESTWQAPPGLLLCSTELLLVMEEFHHLVRHNCQVFDPTYRALLDHSAE